MSDLPANPALDQVGAVMRHHADNLIAYRKQLIEGGIEDPAATELTTAMDERMAFLARPCDCDDDQGVG